MFWSSLMPMSVGVAPLSSRPPLDESFSRRCSDLRTLGATGGEAASWETAECHTEPLLSQSEPFILLSDSVSVALGKEICQNPQMWKNQCLTSEKEDGTVLVELQMFVVISVWNVWTEFGKMARANPNLSVSEEKGT